MGTLQANSCGSTVVTIASHCRKVGAQEIARCQAIVAARQVQRLHEPLGHGHGQRAEQLAIACGPPRVNRTGSRQVSRRCGRVLLENLFLGRRLWVVALEQWGAFAEVQGNPHREAHYPRRVISAFPRKRWWFHSCTLSAALCLHALRELHVAGQGNCHDEPGGAGAELGTSSIRLKHSKPADKVAHKQPDAAHAVSSGASGGRHGGGWRHGGNGEGGGKTQRGA